jgi:hypothetical protein
VLQTFGHSCREDTLSQGGTAGYRGEAKERTADTEPFGCSPEKRAAVSGGSKF